MKINSYSFGDINIEGKKYSSDVIIFPEKIIAAWLRQEGHFLHIDDLLDVLQEKPDVLVVGTGYFGAMEVPQETVDKLVSNGIAVHIEKTAQAVEVYNNLQKEQKVFAAFHLTC